MTALRIKAKKKKKTEDESNEDTIKGIKLTAEQLKESALTLDIFQKELASAKKEKTVKEMEDFKILLAEHYLQLGISEKEAGEVSKQISEDIKNKKIDDLQKFLDRSTWVTGQIGGLSTSLNTILQKNIKDTATDDKEAQREIAKAAIALYLLNQGIAHSEAGIDTAVAIIKSVKASPTTFGLPWSAFSLVTGIAQQLAIAQAPRPPLPQFAGGGLVNALVGENGVEGVSLPVGARVHNAQTTAGMLRGNNPSSINNNTNNSDNHGKVYNIQNMNIQGNDEFDEQVDKRRSSGGNFI